MQFLKHTPTYLLAIAVLLPLSASLMESEYHKMANEQVELLKSDKLALSDHVNNRVKRKIYYFKHYSSKKWPTEIEYYIDDKLTDEQTRLLHWVIESDFEENTCLKFNQIYNTSEAKHQFIWFKANEEFTVSTCKAYIGRENDTRTFHGQPIFLGDWCFNYRGTLVHMIGATLGMFNELQRPDRDDYVDVIDDNIKEEGLSNFVKQGSPGVRTHVPYDYGSALHYHASAWLKDEYRYEHDIPDINDPLSYTVKPHDARLLRLLGQRSELSFYDAQIVNDAYCSHKCPGINNCKNNGYPDPKNCNLCKCPDGYKGDSCDEYAENVGNPSHQCNPLSDVIPVTDTESCVSSPGYESIQPYSTGDHCTWVLSAPPGSLIDMWFQESRFALPYATVERAMCVHWVEIKYKGLNSIRGPRYCSLDSDFRINTLPTKFKPLTSEASKVMVLFKAPQGHLRLEYKDNARTGFKLCFKISTHTPAPTSAPSTITTTAATKNPVSTTNGSNPLPPDNNVAARTGGETTHAKHDNMTLIIAIVTVLLVLLLIFGIIILVLLYKRRRKQPTPVVVNNDGINNPGYGHTIPVVTFNNLPDEEKKLGVLGAFGVTMEDLPPKYDDEFPTPDDKVPPYAISDGDHTNSNAYVNPVYPAFEPQHKTSRKPLPPEPEADYETPQVDHTNVAESHDEVQTQMPEEPVYQNAVSVRNLREKFQ